MHKQKYKQKQKHEHKHTSKAKSGGDGGEKGFSALAWLDGGMVDEVAAEVTAAGATAEDAVPGKTKKLFRELKAVGLLLSAWADPFL